MGAVCDSPSSWRLNTDDTLLEFPTQEDWLKAAGAHADEIMEDVPHFTNIRPIVQFNERVV